MLSVTVLRRQGLLATLDDDQLNELAVHVRPKCFRTGEVVTNRSDRNPPLVLVLSGRLQEVFLAEDGREIGLGFTDAGEHYGEVSVIDGQPSGNAAIAVANSLVGLLERGRAYQLFTQCPAVSHALLYRLCGAIRQASTGRAMLGLPTAQARIAAVLADLVTTVEDGAQVIEMLPPHRAIAIAANVSRESVCRFINALCDSGVARREGDRLILRGVDILLQSPAKRESQVRDYAESAPLRSEWAVSATS